MTILIPLLNRDPGEQLRFALRSITTHMPVTRCILVGGKPKWYTGEHVPHPDYTPDRKEENIRDKVIAGSKGVGEFLFANDDHILQSPFSGVYDKGLLSTTLAGRYSGGSYARLLQNTINRYGDVPNVDTHCPLMMSEEGVQRTLFPWPTFGIGFKTCYAQENGLHSVTAPDIKVPRGVPDAPWFSITDNYRVRDLEKIFPKPCKFEKGFVS